MSSLGNPDRARRRRPNVSYSEQAYDDALRARLAEAGDRSPLYLPNAPMVPDEDEEQDDVVVGEVVGDDSEESDADEYVEEADGTVTRSRKKTMCDAEIAAWTQVAEGLGVSPKDLTKIHRGLKYLYRAACRGSVRYALTHIVIDGLTPADLEWTVGTCEAVAAAIRMPVQEIANTFEPLSNFNGGYFTKTSQHMPLLCAVAMGVEMADKIAEYRVTGSVQAQGFAELLGRVGLGGDVVSMLTAQHATETPEQSARTAGEKLAAELNALDGHSLLQTLYFNLANFRTRVAQFQPDGLSSSFSGYDYDHFDHTKPKGAVKIAETKGVKTVSVTLLHRPLADDAHTGTLKSVYGTAPPNATHYRECHSFPDSAFELSASQRERIHWDVSCDLLDDPPADLQAKYAERDAVDTGPEYDRLRRECDALYKSHLDTEIQVDVDELNRAYDESIERLGHYNETHRAQVDVTTITPQRIARAVKSILTLDNEHAPKMNRFLDQAYPDRASRRWGVPAESYVAVKYDGVPAKLGRLKPRSRKILDKGQNFLAHGVAQRHKAHHLQTWLKLDGNLTTSCFEQIMCMPWKATGAGTVEFYVLITATPPEDFINISIPRLKMHTRDRDEFTAIALRDKTTIYDFQRECYARMHGGENPDNREKTRLTPREKTELAALLEAQEKEAHDEFKAQNPYRPHFVMPYAEGDGGNGAYPAHDPRAWGGEDLAVDHPSYQRARRRLRDQEERAKATKAAKANHARVVAANPDLDGRDIENTLGFGRVDTYTASSGAGSSTDPL